MKVIVSTPYWSLSGVNIFSANLVRGLIARGIDSHILLTEQNSSLVSFSEPLAPFPNDIPIINLPLVYPEDWRNRWISIYEYLENNKPCVYIPNHDWRHSIISPALSKSVAVVAVVHSDDPLHYNHVERLGKYWNGIVTTSKTIAEKVVKIDPSFERKIYRIPIGVPIKNYKTNRYRQNDEPLKIIYHGCIKEHQKRIFDIIKIALRLNEKELPFHINIIGTGPDIDRFKERSECLIESGHLSISDPLPHDEIFNKLKENHIYLLTSEFEGMPNALIEAMSLGCVPIVTDIESGIPELIESGKNGYKIPVGNIDEFVTVIEKLNKDKALLNRISEKARQFVIDHGYTVEKMVENYIKVFKKSLRNKRNIERSYHYLKLPPSRLNGTSILPIEYKGGILEVKQYLYDHEFKVRAKRRVKEIIKLKAFREVKPKPKPKTKFHDYKVIAAIPSSRVSGVDVFSIHLVRGLLKKGINAEIILTDPDNKSCHYLDLPKDIPVKHLQVRSNRKNWKKRWAAMIDYLEKNAPCIYIPNYDWYHSCVTPQLSNSVKVIGIAHSDEDLHYEHLVRLGDYFNAVVGVSKTITDHLKKIKPEVSDRLHFIPYGVKISSGFQPRNNENRKLIKITYAGRMLQKQKRIFDIVEILRLLSNRSIPFEMTMVGEGKDKEEFRNRCIEYGVDKFINFTGALPNAEVVKRFSENDIFILTSDYEGLPVSLLEAMSQGCIPIVSDIKSGIPEVINHGINGFKVEPGNFKKYADYIEELYVNHSSRKQISIEAHQSILKANFSVEAMVESYTDLLHRVINDKLYVRPKNRILPPPMKKKLNWKSYIHPTIRKQLKGFKNKIKLAKAL